MFSNTEKDILQWDLIPTQFSVYRFTKESMYLTGISKWKFTDILTRYQNLLGGFDIFPCLARQFRNGKPAVVVFV
jgi:hypothetical protein